MHERVNTANHSEGTQSMMTNNNASEHDTFRKLSFVDHLDTCQGVSTATGIIYKDRLDKINEFRKINVHSSKSI